MTAESAGPAAPKGEGAAGHGQWVSGYAFRPAQDGGMISEQLAEAAQLDPGPVIMPVPR